MVNANAYELSYLVLYNVQWETFTREETPVRLTAWTSAAIGMRLYIVQLVTLARAWTPARAGTSACLQLAAVTIPRVPTLADVPALLVSYRGIFITYKCMCTLRVRCID